MRRSVVSILVTALALTAACDEARRQPTGPSTPARPSCALPVCAPCACDQTTVCDDNCDACDPECGGCRAEGAECTTPRDAGPQTNDDAGTPPRPLDGGPMIDAGPCTEPASQGLSQPCCISRGIDACGAGLFCEAFDGRTQPTCYAEGSRRDGQTCTADVHCAGGRCPASTHVCGPGPGDPCDPFSEVCAPGADGRMFTCDRELRVCTAAPITCDPETHQPCAGSESCYVTFGATPAETMTGCYATGSGAEGAPCTRPSDCERDLACLAPLIQSCYRICSGTRPCPSGPCQMLPASNIGLCTGGG